MKTRSLKRFLIVSYAGWVELEITAFTKYEALLKSGFLGRATAKEIAS